MSHESTTKGLLIVLIAALLAWAASARADGEKYALLVGVHNYSEEKVLHPLAYAEPDVTELAQVLRDSGLAPRNVILMTQAAAAAEPRYLPEKKRVLKELALLLANRTDKDTVLVAFAGHGVHFKGDKNSYFCPSDAQLDDRSTLISLVDVYGQLEKSKAGVKVLLVDACRNDPFQDRTRAARMDLESVTRPEIPEPPKGVVAFFSCSEKEKAYETEKLNHGVFFHFVIEGLKGEAAPDQEEVSLLDLGAYVTRQVGDFVRAEYGQVQQPELAGRSSGSAALLHVDRASFLYRKGVAHVDAQEFQKAVEDFTAAIKINSNRPDAFVQRARAYNGAQAYDKAVADCDKALHLNPDWADAYWERAMAHGGLNDPAGRIADYSELLRLEPKNAVAFNNRGYAYVEQGDYDNAIADYTKAIHLDPKYTTARQNRGDAWSNKQEYDKAVADYSEVIRLDPKNASAYTSRGSCWNNKRQYDQAVADFSEVIRLDPKNASAFNDRGGVWNDKGKYDKALFDYNTAIRLDPKNVVAYIGRGVTWCFKQEYDKAIADFNTAIRLDPNNAVAFSGRGTAYQGKGDAVRAKADLDKADQLNKMK